MLRTSIRRVRLTAHPARLSSLSRSFIPSGRSATNNIHIGPLLNNGRSNFARRGYATATGPKALVFLEHSNGSIDASSLSAIAAATQLGGEVTGLIVGGDEGAISDVVEKARKIEGVTAILHTTHSTLTHPLPESLTPLLQSLITSKGYTHVLSAHTSLAKSTLPRLAAVLDTPALSDVTSLSYKPDEGTLYERPIYAGNAIASIRAPASMGTNLFTIRATSFTAPSSSSSAPASAESVPFPDSDSPALSKHITTSLTTSTRPELGSASRVVSGGRALKNAETFAKTIEPLADVLGAAIGASRAAVDSGFVDNSLQVGQTGKVVAPALYIAVGISGAIQHLAGMKDSKLIVAINKDADAPIFQVADAGLVADLYEAVPELVEKLKK